MRAHRGQPPEADMLQLAALVWELNSRGQEARPGPGPTQGGKGAKESLGGSLIHALIHSANTDTSVYWVHTGHVGHRAADSIAPYPQRAQRQTCRWCSVNSAMTKGGTEKVPCSV